MGSNLSRGENRRALVKDREADAHKLLGVASGNSSDKFLFQRKREFTYPSDDGQHNSFNIHKQVWGHSLPRIEQTHERAVAVVFGEKYNDPSEPPTRDPQLHSRRGVQGNEGQIRLDVVS